MNYRALLFIFIFFSLNVLPQAIDQSILEKLDPRLLETLSVDEISKINSDESSSEEALENLQDQALFNEKMKKESNKFGYDFINRIQISSEIQPNLPLTNEYLISIGDELKVILTGSKKEIYDLDVQLDGTIFFPGIGSISVAGETFFEVKQKIKNIVDSSFLGTSVDLSFNRLNMKKISIIGAVNNPGVFIVNPFTSVSTSIAYAGGLTDSASIRTIEIVSSNGKRQNLDLYDFLIFGDRSNDLIINSGDTIVVKATDKFVNISGEVLRPMLYEYSAKDKFSDLLDFAMGLKSNADENSIFVQEIKNNTVISAKVKLSDFVGSKQLLEFEVNNKLISENKDIKVIGKSVSAGFYPKSKYKMLSEVINDLTFSPEIYPFYFIVDQKSKSGLKNETMYLSLADKKTYENILLQDNVEILFFDKDSIKNKKRRLEGMFEALDTTLAELENENEILFDEMRRLAPSKKEKENIKNNNFLLKNYLKLLTKENSETIQEYELSLILDTKVPNLHNKFISMGNDGFEAPIVGNFRPQQLYDYFNVGSLINFEQVKVLTKDGLKDNAFSKSFEAGKVLQINFPEEYIDTFVVNIQGEVNYPGSYTVSSQTTLNDLYSIAGGLSENAAENSIFFSRASVKEKEKETFDVAKKVLLDAVLAGVSNPNNDVSTNFTDIQNLLVLVSDIEVAGRISGDLYPNSQLSLDLTLENGDFISVPALSNTVSVIGEVLNPITIALNDNFEVEDYIKAAGSYTDFSDKKNIYVLRSNGTSIPINNNLFSGRYYLEPGDTIVVPRDIDKLSTLPLITAATKILSDIAFAAASLNAIQD